MPAVWPILWLYDMPAVWPKLWLYDMPAVWSMLCGYMICPPCDLFCGYMICPPCDIFCGYIICPPCDLFCGLALTTPLALLSGIARNDRRATVFVGRSCPPNLYLENSGNKCYTPYAFFLFWDVICKVTVKFNQFLFMISMISSPLYSISIYDQLGIAPWFELSVTKCK